MGVNIKSCSLTASTHRQPHFFPFFLCISKGMAARQSRTATLFQIKIPHDVGAQDIFI